jgi:hypothetical protein
MLKKGEGRELGRVEIIITGILVYPKCHPMFTCRIASRAALYQHVPRACLAHHRVPRSAGRPRPALIARRPRRRRRSPALPRPRVDAVGRLVVQPAELEAQHGHRRRRWWRPVGRRLLHVEPDGGARCHPRARLCVLASRAKKNFQVVTCTALLCKRRWCLRAALTGDPPPAPAALARVAHPVTDVVQVREGRRPVAEQAVSPLGTGLRFIYREALAQLPRPGR